MQELLFFILGLVIGGLTMTVLMSCLQINRINNLEKVIHRFDIDMEYHEDEE